MRLIASLPILCLLLLPMGLHAQNTLVDLYIAVTDTVDEEGVVFAASSDDAEQINQEMDGLFDDDLDAGWEGAPEDQNSVHTALRFRDLLIPQGATIDSAFLVLHSHEAKTAADIANITIIGEASDNAQTFTMETLASERPATTASVLWTVAEEWVLWGAYRSPDLKSIVQEVVDRAGWASGHAIALLLKGEDQGVSDLEHAREFESFENIADPEEGGDGQNHPERRPRLMVYYSTGGVSVADVAGTASGSFRAYPNPALGGIVHLELATDVPATIKLLDIHGRLLRTLRHTNGRSLVVPTGDLPAGVYCIQVVQGRTASARQLLIGQ